MKGTRDIIISGVLFLTAALSALAAALLSTAYDKAAQLDVSGYEYNVGITEYTDTYKAVENAKHGVARILCEGDERELSTAFAVGKENGNTVYFLTALHGVRDGDIYVYTDHIAKASVKDGRILLDYKAGSENRYRAELAAYDEKYDIALLKTERSVENISPLKILDSNAEIIQGEKVYGLCFPVSADYVSAGDGFKKTLYADSGSVAVAEGETAVIFEDQEDFLHLKMELSGGCSGGPVILSNGTAAGMIKQGNFSIIIDPVNECEVYEPAGNGTAVKACDLARFLTENGVSFETGALYEEPSAYSEKTEFTDETDEKLRSELMKALKTAENAATLVFGTLNVIACAVFINRPDEG